MKTNVTLRFFESPKSNTKAFIELKLDNMLIVKGLSLVEGKKGLFLSFPSSKGKDGKYYNTVYCLEKDWRKKLEEICIEKYKEEKKAASNTTDNSTGEGDDFS